MENSLEPDSDFDELFEQLPRLWQSHSPNSDSMRQLRAQARACVNRSVFSVEDHKPQSFGPFGEIIIPFTSLGTAVSSVNCFDIDELILFAFYWSKRFTYCSVLDIGANIGLHSVVLAKCGFLVDAIEPDPRHVELLNRNLILNEITDVKPLEAAVSDERSLATFVRVNGNTTGSHISGSKSSAYGSLDYIEVKTLPFRELIGKYDFIKIDAEGHEARILLDSTPSDWKNTDAMVEVGSRENARLIFDFFQKMKVSLFAQKQGWKMVEALEHMPMNYKDGSLFISGKGDQPWENVPCD